VNLGVAQQRPDYLLSDFNIYTYDILLVETSALGGIAEYEADLEVLGLYGQTTAELTPQLRLNAGLRYEDAEQSITLVDLFDEGNLSQSPALKNSYVLPAATLTWSLTDDMQLRLHGSRTLGRPQFRELAPQLYFDTDSDRQFFGNPFLGDSKLTNAEARFEWYFGPQQRLSVAGFYKNIDRPIESIATVAGGGTLQQTFANAPKAELYGAELEAVKFWGLPALGAYRVVTSGNYTYSKSSLKVDEGAVTILNDTRGERPASEVFNDGDRMTGQSTHLINVQAGIENTQRLQQATLLLNYSSPRVTSRGQILGQARLNDIIEKPGLSLDLVLRQGMKLMGREAEFNVKVRNILQNDYEEYQQVGDDRIFINKYDQGTSVSFGASLKL
jgi:TonB-dependent receptor